jgi:hypothetical protein
MKSNSIICIYDCPNEDSIFNIKHSLEEHSICRVQKIFATKYCESGNNKPSKKIIYIWVEWLNTNASGSFTTRLSHHGEASLFKLDRWNQPICTKRDEYGNEIEHKRWIVMPTSIQKFNEDEIKFGSRYNEEIWQIYLAPGDSSEDIDEEQEQILTLQPVLEIPQLNHNSPNSQMTPESNKEPVLTLSMPYPVEQDIKILKKGVNDDFIRENFNIVATETDCWNEYKKFALSKEELKKLSRGVIN